MKWLFGLGMMALVMLGAWGCSTIEAKEAYLTIDINPRIDLTVNGQDKVIDAGALNEDGEVLLLDLDLIGKKYDEAIEMILDQAINLGFIDIEAPETLVSVSSIAENSEFGETIRNKVMNKVNASFEERAMMGKAVQKTASESTVAEAGQFGVTPEKLNLAKRFCEWDDSMDLEDAVRMSTQQLLEQMQTRKKEKKEINQALKEEFFAARESIRDEYIPQIQALEEQIEAIQATSGDVTALQEELNTLRTAFQTAMQALRDQYHNDSEAEKTRIRTEAQNRINEHAQAVSAFRSQIQTRRQTMGEAIRQYQSGSNNTQSTSGNPTTGSTSNNSSVSSSGSGGKN
jgi:hypothetical protein